MSTERRNSKRARRICLETHLRTDDRGDYMICTCGHCGGMRFNPATTDWRADHARRWAEGGRDTPDNIFPIITSHDREHKAPNDTREVAKGKRVRAKHYGVKQRKGPPMPGSRDSGWKKTFNGGWKRR